MIHQPLGGAQGQAADTEIQANEILHHKLTLDGYLAEFTGQGMDPITQDTGQLICIAGQLASAIAVGGHSYTKASLCD